jgi:hypothetical protein
MLLALRPWILLVGLAGAVASCDSGSSPSSGGPSAERTAAPAALPSPATTPRTVPGGDIAKNVCTQLVAAGVAKNCKEPEDGSHGRTDGRKIQTASVGYELAGVPTAEGAVVYWLTDAAFNDKSDAITRSCGGPDPMNLRGGPYPDYPDECVISVKTRILVTWGATRRDERG